jgi:hypothetical protein
MVRADSTNPDLALHCTFAGKNNHT